MAVAEWAGDSDVDSSGGPWAEVEGSATAAIYEWAV